MADPALTGQQVFITGATAGIGEACAEAFAAAGADLIVCGRRADRLTELADRLEKAHGIAVTTLELDVRNQPAVEKQLRDIDRIDILVNNAGLSRGLDPIHEGKLSDWEEMIDTNVKGLLYVTHAVLPKMIARHSGHIINIGSIAGWEVYPKGAVYCASKHAVDAITKGMRLDLIHEGIKVSTVDPGLVETEFSLVRFHGDAEKAKKPYENIDPLTAQDVAETVLWVATRPAHVNAASVLLVAGKQASTTVFDRR